MATFSVIVPVYHAAHTIERCVRSIATSGGEDVQIILVEDCSRDESWEVCNRLAQEYDTVICLRNDRNRGVSHTRNRALEMAAGEYLLFVDSDDWVDSDYIPVFRQAIEAGHHFAVCGFVNHDERQNGRTDVYAWSEFQGERTVALESEMEKLYQQCLLQQLWNKVFVTAVVRAHNIRFDESISIGEDTRFILDYISRSGIHEITLINRPLYHYMRDQDGSLMFQVGRESVEEPLINLRKMYQIMGYSDEALESRLVHDRQTQIESYAYLIMHNAGMSLREKRRRILALDAQQGPELLRRNRTLFLKERIHILLRRMGVGK